MSDKAKPDLSEHEDESVPLDDVLRKLVTAKPSDEKASEKRPKGRKGAQAAKSKSHAQ